MKNTLDLMDSLKARNKKTANPGCQEAAPTEILTLGK